MVGGSRFDPLSLVLGRRSCHPDLNFRSTNWSEVAVEFYARRIVRQAPITAHRQPVSIHVTRGLSHRLVSVDQEFVVGAFYHAPPNVWLHR